MSALRPVVSNPAKTRQEARVLGHRYFHPDCWSENRRGDVLGPDEYAPLAQPGQKFRVVLCARCGHPMTLADSPMNLDWRTR